MSNNYFLDSVDYKKIRLSSISQNENNNSISQSQNHPIETFLTQKNTEQDTKPAIIDEDISDIKPVKNTIQFVKEENIKGKRSLVYQGFLTYIPEWNNNIEITKIIPKKKEKENITEEKKARKKQEYEEITFDNF